MKNKNRQALLVLPFLKKFIHCNNIPLDLENSLIGTTHNVIPCDIYINVETHDNKKINTNLYIGTHNGNKDRITYKHYYYISWGAITYYLRNFTTQSWYILLKPIRDIYDQKNKKYFCDYLFRNKNYRNGIKRYNFYKILNSKKKVNNITNNKRFSLDMFNDAVKQHKPYRFSIAFENDIVDGWVTEKIINSFLAGCIPIYDGTDDVYKYFNKESFINAKDFNSLHELANYVIKVNNDTNLYNKYINSSPTTIEKLQSLFWWEKFENN